MSITKRREVLNTLAPEDPFSSCMLKDSLYMERPYGLSEDLKGTAMHKKNKSLKPKVGDLIACDDSDVGIVVKTSYLRDNEEGLMVSVKWSSGKVYTDPWDSVVFDGKKNRPLFRILSAT